MTATYSLPEAISTRYRFRSKPVDARAIQAVVPTFKDWEGLKVTLDSLLNLKTSPKRIRVVNDNREAGIPDWLNSYPAEVVDYPGNRGPATARNRGFGIQEDIPVMKVVSHLPDKGEANQGLPNYLRTGHCPELKYKDYTSRPTVFEWASEIDWVYFTDCGCTHDPNLFLQFETTWREFGDSCVALSGPVLGSGPGAINEYMTEQGVLNPPMERNLHGTMLPRAVVTANALVCALPFAFIGGFDPEFREAAGEDLDLGLRLRQFGIIGWSPKSRAYHRFDEDDSDFYRRFRRYGRGNRQLEVKHNLPSLRARPFQPDKRDDPEHQRLAKLSLEAMHAGYDEAVDPKDRGILRILEQR